MSVGFNCRVTASSKILLRFTSRAANDEEIKPKWSCTTSAASQVNVSSITGQHQQHHRSTSAASQAVNFVTADSTRDLTLELTQPAEGQILT
ncbi:hypothetical protein ElyMa_001700900 [Elysia marginata]|uniref:Uncharacterized protein n=1 Tax=Elysia marginata TaxID=1093978 RepID=A0AAV4JWN7_9GAST|nr:hypothetical protein ElyMa_001700900 [Elysia marginata]